MTNDLKTLQSLAKIRAMASQQKLNGLRKREAELRRELDSLSEMRTEADAADFRLQSMRGIGADLLWKSWLARTRSRLMTELAQIKALMEPLIAQSRREIGQSEAASELVVEENKQKRAQRLKTERDKLIEQQAFGKPPPTRDEGA